MSINKTEVLYQYPTPSEYKAATSSPGNDKLNDYELGAWENISQKIEMGYHLSHKQLEFWYKLKAKREGIEDKKGKGVGTTGLVNYRNLVQSLAQAQTKIERPKITIPPIHIRKNSATYSRFPNDYTILHISTRDYLGALRVADGAFLISKKVDREILAKTREVLGKLDRDFIGTIVKEAADHCVFCGRELDNKHSRAVHYGPTCAENYNLPWGDEKEGKSDA